MPLKIQMTLNLMTLEIILYFFIADYLVMRSFFNIIYYRKIFIIHWIKNYTLDVILFHYVLTTTLLSLSITNPLSQFMMIEV